MVCGYHWPCSKQCFVPESMARLHDTIHTSTILHVTRHWEELPSFQKYIILWRLGPIKMTLTPGAGHFAGSRIHKSTAAAGPCDQSMDNQKPTDPPSGKDNESVSSYEAPELETGATCIGAFCLSAPLLSFVSFHLNRCRYSLTLVGITPFSPWEIAHAW